MSSKTKTQNDSFESIEEFASNVAAQIGMAAMSAAAVMSLVELPHIKTQRIEAVLQPAYAMTAEAPIHDTPSRGEETMRREKEESPHSRVSYGVMMRSHPTTGR